MNMNCENLEYLYREGCSISHKQGLIEVYRQGLTDGLAYCPQEDTDEEPLTCDPINGIPPPPPVSTETVITKSNIEPEEPLISGI